MKILRADFILKCDESFEIIKDGAISFDKKILAVDSFENIKKLYKDEEIEYLGEGSVIMPGLINTHLHLEFSSNRISLDYGDFMTWLKSVIEKRDELLNRCEKDNCIKKALDTILESGTTTIGAISSFGDDLKECKDTPLNVVYFTEILGSDPASVDMLFSNFLERLDRAKECESESFIPAISIHSPYSTHPILAKKVLEIAKDEGMLVSTHLLESYAEREWLDRGEGTFLEFLKSFNPHAKPMIRALEYIELFRDNKTLFTHLCYATKEEIDAIFMMGGSITHCPRSNRLLGSRRLEIENLNEFNIATDGLSSNNSLSLWDEMRAFLMLHESLDINLLAKMALRSVTIDAAKALALKKGSLKEGYDSDFIVLNLHESIDDISKIALMLLLFTKDASQVFIDGKRLK